MSSWGEKCSFQSFWMFLLRTKRKEVKRQQNEDIVDVKGKSSDFDLCLPKVNTIIGPPQVHLIPIASKDNICARGLCF